MLDLTDLQDVCANTLSGGQKRKLSLGIAILGNPQVGISHIYIHTLCTALAQGLHFDLARRHWYFPLGTPSLLTY